MKNTKATTVSLFVHWTLFFYRTTEKQSWENLSIQKVKVADEENKTCFKIQRETGTSQRYTGTRKTESLFFSRDKDGGNENAQNCCQSEAKRDVRS